MAIDGDLRDFSLPSLLQVVCGEQRRATLLLHNGSEDGKIFFEGGAVVHALAGRRDGEEAVYELLSWTEGTFRLADRAAPCPQTIQSSCEQLLLEGMRRLDESRREEELRSEPPRGRAALSNDDLAVENELLGLLSQLEREGQRLSLPKARKRPAEAIAALCATVNLAVEHAERHAATPPSLEKVLEDGAELTPQLSLVQAHGNRLSADALVQAYESWGWTTERRRQIFAQILSGLLHVLGRYLDTCGARLRSAGARASWTETYEPLLQELNAGIREIPL